MSESDGLVGEDSNSSATALFDSIETPSSGDELPLIRNRLMPPSRAALTRTDALKAQLRYWAVPIAITAITMLLVVLHVHRLQRSAVGSLAGHRRRGAITADVVIVTAPQLSPCRERHLVALLHAPLARDVLLLHSTAHAPTDAQLRRLGNTLRVAGVPDAAAHRAAVSWLAASPYARAWIVDADAALGSACAGGWAALLAAHDGSGVRGATADYVAIGDSSDAQRLFRVSKRLATLAAARANAPPTSLAALCSATPACTLSTLAQSCLITECWSDAGDGGDVGAAKDAPAARFAPVQ
jgi:hypothetical protein